jgi:GDPmannose 4,6-dehydratase
MLLRANKTNSWINRAMTQKVALVTRATSQFGTCLILLLLNKDCILRGIKRRSSSFNTTRIDHLYVDAHHPQAKILSENILKS